jgi:hypothetical protein
MAPVGEDGEGEDSQYQKPTCTNREMTNHERKNLDKRKPSFWFSSRPLTSPE